MKRVYSKRRTDVKPLVFSKRSRQECMPVLRIGNDNIDKYIQETLFLGPNRIR